MVMANPVQHWDLGVGSISCHSWNKDRSQIAVSPNNNEVHIFAWTNGKWIKAHLLLEHDMPITAIDWAPQSNRIVTCAQDKNAFVWTFEPTSKQWKPELVVVRITRSATCVRWSPNENKFAVGSGSKLVSICYYEKENDWWVSKQIRKPIRSTVTSIDWHPNNILLAVGSCDFHARVYSAHVKDVEPAPQPTPWGNRVKFGELIMDQSNGGGGWVHAVKFSPNGTRLAWVGHDSSVSVVDAAQSDVGMPSDEVEEPPKLNKNRLLPYGRITTIKDWYLPFTGLEWVTENSFVAVGHDCCPMLFAYTGASQLQFVSKLDIPAEKKVNKMSAMNKFRNLDSVSTAAVDTALKTLHQNRITGICAHTGPRNNVTKFSTVSIDGMLVLWDLRESIDYCAEMHKEMARLAAADAEETLEQKVDSIRLS